MDPFDRNVDMLVTRVRRKIEPDPKVPRFLLAVPGAGYKLMARMQPVEARQYGAGPIEPERRHDELGFECDEALRTVRRSKQSQRPRNKKRPCLSVRDRGP
jgi:hypothetical protein